jgi:AcrR family transcriptional regulator
MTDQPVLSRREEYSEATRQALLAAAREIFVQQGYQETGIETISRAARVTRGAFYHHFADKKALLEALVIDIQGSAARTVVARARSKADPWERLRIGAAAFLEVCMEPAYRRLVIQEAPAVLGASRCRAIAEAHAVGLFIAALRELQKIGQFNFENVELAGRMIAAMICEAALLLADAKHPAQLKRQINSIIERILDCFRKG